MTVEVLACMGEYQISQITFEKQLKIFLLPSLLLNVIITLNQWQDLLIIFIWSRCCCLIA